MIADFRLKMWDVGFALCPLSSGLCLLPTAYCLLSLINLQFFFFLDIHNVALLF
jgi:hypothetical protein